MIQQISYYISKAGIAAAAGKIEDERRRLSDMPTPAAFVSYAPSLPASVGWYGYRVAFNGVGRVQLEAALDSLRRHFRLRDLREWYDRFSGFYVVEALFAVRMNLPGGVFGGGAPTPEPDALNFTMPNGGTISLNKIGYPTVVELEYSLDGGATWTVWAENGSGNRSITLTAGQRMYVRNTSETQTGFSTSDNDYYQFGFTNTAEAHGNTNSLLCKNADSVTTLSPYCYYSMFKNCTSLVTAPELPATVTAGDCYSVMFYGCSSLVHTPELPATAIRAHCYNSMFRSCTSLVTAPELPATDLANDCYDAMFRDCTSLVTAPELPATTLFSFCYYSMFYGCTLLTEIRTRMTDISATNCTGYWLYNVSAQGDLYCPAGLTIPAGDSGIPSGWTRHDI